MKRLWSPWRSQYVAGQETEDASCIFCRFPQEQDDSRNLVVYRGELAYVVMNRFPYNSGHLMIVPYEHTAEFQTLSASALAEVMSLLSTCLTALRTAFKPDGYNAGMNLGSAAGAGVADHIHMHVVPRWVGDTNFMPALADVKVMPEMLEDSYRKLAAAMSRARSSGTTP